MNTSLTPRTDKAAFREKVVRGEPVTAQEVFDVVVEGVILQGGGSFDGHECRYRAKNGRECGAGQAIPDELYIPFMEGRSVHINGCFGIRSLKPHDRLLSDLQGIHDACVESSMRDGDKDAGFLIRFKRKVYGISLCENLTVPPLAQIEEPLNAPG